MKYLIKIDKYIKDRFKIYEKDKLLYSGEKIGDVASYFDGFIGETYSKGANFVFFDVQHNEVLRVERNFYNTNKEYKLFSAIKEVGKIKSHFEGETIEIDIEYKDFKKHISFNKNEYILEIENIGTIESVKQGFRSYEELDIKIENKEYEMFLIALSVYIWDVFIKNKIAFMFKK